MEVEDPLEPLELDDPELVPVEPELLPEVSVEPELLDPLEPEDPELVPEVLPSLPEVEPEVPPASFNYVHVCQIK